MKSNAVPASIEEQKTLKLGHLNVIHAQREWLRRLESDMLDKKAVYNQAKERAEQASEDLKRLCDPNIQQQGELFAGELLIDPHTGLIRSYRSIAEIERELQEAEDKRRRDEEAKKTPRAQR